jgi:two-component system sensor histidine kinase PilS (NtrC family)
MPRSVPIASSDARTWLRLLAKVRPIIITVLLAVEALIVNLTADEVSGQAFVTAVITWYVISIFFFVWTHVASDYQRQARVQVIADAALSILLIHVSGGIESPFAVLLPLLIIVASVLLSRRWVYGTAIGMFLCHAAVLELASTGRISSHAAGVPAFRTTQIVVVIDALAFAAVAYVASTLAHRLREASTELADKNDELTNLQALHAQVISSMQSGLITTDYSGRITLANRRGEELLETPSSTLLRQPIRRFFPDRIPTSATHGTHELQYLTPQGKHKIFAVNVTSLHAGSADTAGFMYSFEDRTQIHRLEREVRQRDRLAAVGRLAAGIAHEVRNPLASIAGAVNMLGEAPEFNEEQRTLLRIVQSESTRLEGIIADFLSYSREKQYQLAPHNLVSVVDDTLTLFERSLEPEGRIHVRRAFPTDPVMCVIDVERIRQVLWNLIVNAKRAMPDGGDMDVSISVHQGAVELSLRDTGVGIAPSLIDRIFEPFVSGFDGGSGLGLAICYQIVHAHDAEIRVESRPGEGTAFTISLKLAPALELPTVESSVYA